MLRAKQEDSRSDHSHHGRLARTKQQVKAVFRLQPKQYTSYAPMLSIYVTAKEQMWAVWLNQPASDTGYGRVNLLTGTEHASELSTGQEAAASRKMAECSDRFPCAELTLGMFLASHTSSNCCAKSCNSGKHGLPEEQTKSRYEILSQYFQIH